MPRIITSAKVGIGKCGVVLRPAIDREFGVKRFFYLAFPFVSAFLSVDATICQAKAADLVVTITDVRPGAGNIRVALYSDPNSFRDESHAFRVASATADASTVNVVFQDIPNGSYAALAYHDANDNKKLDLSLGMFPTEAWGLSNDPKVLFGPPRFGPSSFYVGDGKTSIAIVLHY